MKTRSFQPRPKNAAIALVVTLAAMVLLAGITVAFFSRALLNRQIAYTSANFAKVDLLGRASLEAVIGELRQEIADPSNSTIHQAGDGPDIYEPKTAANVMPEKMGVDGPDQTGSVTIVKVSADGVGLYTGGSIIGSATGIERRSANGRYLPAEKWFGTLGPRLGSQSKLPTWVLVKRNGGMAPPALADAKNPKNGDYVIGRFAYTIYDVSGLLDINVAGFPSGWTAGQIQQLKGSAAGADVSLLGLDTDALLAWRNEASTGDYADYVHDFATRNGFTKVKAGDAAFLNRRDLLRAAENNIAGLDPSALGHLTVFSRENTAPSWGPSTPAGSSVDYAAQANSTAVVNRFLPQVRFPAEATITRYRSNGGSYTYEVRSGDSLVQRRFPLDRLMWLGANGPQNGGTDKSIQDCFGLKWMASLDPALSAGSKVWVYVGPSGATAQSSIKTLEQVAGESAKREPNFFELLQAGILSGSLGVDSCGSTSFPSVVQAPSAYQVLRIGACMVDQYDVDGYPTVIEYAQGGAAWQACGVENLPFINVSKTVTGGDPAAALGSVPGSTAALAAYHLVGLWNPQRTSGGGSLPEVRLRIQGSIGILNSWSTGLPGYAWVNGPVAYGYGYKRVLDSSIPLASTAGKGVNGFSSPGLLSNTDVSGSLADPGPAGNGWTVTPAAMTSSSVLAPGATYVAYRLPDLYLKGTQAAPIGWQANSYWGYVQTAYSIDPSKPFQCSLEFETPSGAWIAYSFLNGNNDPATWQKAGSPWQTHFTAPPFTVNMPSLADTYCKAPVYLGCDPRSVRFGAWQYARNYGPTGPERAPDALITSLWPTAAQVAGSPYASTFSSYGYGGGGPTPADASKMALFGSSFFYPAQLCRNNTPNTAPNSSYADRDGIRRIADSGLYTSGSSTGNPYQNSADRPILLNRPFRSVAELGYVFRDLPWKSLDLFSANSADAGLLDLFSLRDGEAPVAAGRIHVNSQDPQVLEALLKGTSTDAMTENTAIGNPSGLASDLVSYTAANPLANKAGLSTQAGPALGSSSFSSSAEEKIKPRREAFLRALADGGQTRTWNLMIDLVAQTGRYAPTAGNLEQFVVEGERRYWLHVAIDRFTGEVIERQMEQDTGR